MIRSHIVRFATALNPQKLSVRIMGPGRGTQSNKRLKIQPQNQIKPSHDLCVCMIRKERK